MSKMSQLHAELSEQAAELGFETLEQALDNGYHIVEDLVNGTSKLEKIDELWHAHQAWLKEKEEMLKDLTYLKGLYEGISPDENIIEHAIEFIKKGEM